MPQTANRAVAAELRVHGVGGSSPASILGLGGDGDADLMAFGDRTGFWRRQGDPTIEGYVWGGLTSGSSLQPLWLVLLPFTLVNVAGWMHEPETVLSARRIHAVRRLTFLFGLTMTATYSIWVTVMLEDSIGTKWLPTEYPTVPFGQWRTTPRWGVVATAAVAAVLLALLALLARSSRTVEDNVETFLGVPSKETRADPGIGAYFGVAAKNDESLTDPGFFNRRRDSGRLLGWHVLWSVIVLTALSTSAWFAATGSEALSSDPPTYLQVGFAAIGAAQVVLIVALAFVSFVRKPTGFRWSAPAVACSLAVMLAHASFAGGSRWLDNRLDIDAGATFLLADVMVLTVVLMVAGVVVWALRHRILFPDMATVDPGSDEPVPTNSSFPGSPPNGATRSARKLAARFRALTVGVTRLDIVLTHTALVFGVLAVFFGVVRVADHRERFRWEPLAIAGSQLITWAGAALVLLLWLKRRDPKTRKTVGIIWDLLTFWPRRFHPFAVRPYSEQAVSELRGRILQLRHESTRVLLSCHSQGTVIGFSALAPLVPPGPGERIPVSLVTYGSPLGGLYAVFFPGYFTAEVVRRVRDGVEDWHNFRRRTDPIGSDIPGVDSTWLASPGVTPPTDPARVLRPASTRAECDRRPWFKVEGHSNYRNEPAMKEYIDALRQE